MPSDSEALSVLFWDIHRASNGIDGGTGCNFILFRIDIVSYNRFRSEGLVQFGENYDVNIKSEETDTILNKQRE